MKQNFRLTLVAWFLTPAFFVLGLEIWHLTRFQIGGEIIASVAVIYFIAYAVATKQFCRHRGKLVFVEHLSGAQAQEQGTPHGNREIHRCENCGGYVTLAEKRNE